jgi:YgiT-type zinc finger domain-containing protein
MGSNSNAEDNELVESTAPCLECGAGLLRLSHITYFTWLNDELITVPNFPAWICDVCGRREFDPRSVNWLNMLLDPVAGRKPKIRPDRNPPLLGADRIRP